MKKEFKLIICGLIFIFALSVTVLLSLNHYMDIQTEKDVREIAKVYLMGVSDQEANRFEAIKTIRFNQLNYMNDSIEKLGPAPTKDQIVHAVNNAAEFQSFTNCSLVSEDGYLEALYGPAINHLGDQDFLISSMQYDREIVTGAWSGNEQLIVFASPLHVPMENGTTSAGILWCKPISSFVKLMNLDNPESLVYFHLIRRDSTYVVRNDDATGDNYFDKINKYLKPEGMTAEEAAKELAMAIDTNSDFMMHTKYTENNGLDYERRTVYATPLDDSNWYLLSIIPYGVLDSMISAMGEARYRGMIVSMAILTAGLLAVVLFYFRMTRKQLHDLEEAKKETEEALEEAKASQEEAIESKDRAEEAMLEAEAATEDAVKAREDAERSKEEAIEAKNRAEDALMEAEAANEDAMKAREEAEKAREEAVEANKAKSDFLSNMSHDIRTPMNAIVGMTAIAEEHIDDKDRVQDCLHKITLSGKHLLGLINDVLDMSKIESGKMTLNMEALSLREAMETMCEIIRPQIRSKGQNFDILISNIISEEVYCDSVRLNQVLLNFLSNAVKFTPEGGFITVSLYQEESPKGDGFVRTHMIVRDTGMGMSEEFRKKLFTAFEREDNLRVHKIQGTGLGMTITKHIVEAMGGTILVDSTPGEGSSFHVTLDLEKVTESDRDMKLPDWSILIVDDNMDLCQTAVLSLEELGTRPEWCLSGEEAIEKVKEKHDKGEDYFAILIDYKMEGMDGLETSKKITEILGDKTPISLISAYDWTEIEKDAREAGVNGFIPKPLFKSTLYHELRKYIPGAETEDNKELHLPQNAVDLTGLKVLLAEDIDVNAEVAKMMLSGNGIEVDRAEDGKVAVEKFESSEPGQYDVILMDLRMPHMNGFEATKAIRALDRKDAQTIPIIAMTADAFAEDANKCYEVGMNAHIAKPIDIHILLRTLSHHCKKDQSQD
ncbi:MAG: response regulator [Lachnospiraceae bacterium]|nr:response regulator [Lachnospiraceae bacterium]